MYGTSHENGATVARFVMPDDAERLVREADASNVLR
jgi:hypothetical protein